MASTYTLILIVYMFVCINCNTCPKQCDCDIVNNLNRASCVGQNIISIDVGVPKFVQIYVLSHNVISELDNYCFKEIGYTAIEVLNLSYNFIFWIGVHAFMGLDKLVHLDLSNNRLRYIQSDLLWETPHLDTVDLSGNIFETIKNEPFLIHNKLQVLNLNNCRIKALPDRVFNRLPNLKKLDLSENYMVSLCSEVLQPIRKLVRLELNSPYWKCNPSFIGLENWILSRGITYEKQCMKFKGPNMSQKIISAVNVETEVNISDVWNVPTLINESQPTLKPKKELTPLEKFDKEFSAIQAFVIGLELGVGIGVVATYIWLRSFYQRRNYCARSEIRRRRRAQLSDGEANLLWNTVVYPTFETPQLYRRQLSPERSLPVMETSPRNEMALQSPGDNLPDRTETPPPPYHECRRI